MVSSPGQVKIELTADEWWKEVTPEKAFLARVYGEHLRSTNVCTKCTPGETTLMTE